MASQLEQTNAEMPATHTEVLIADDDPAALRMISKIVSRAGYRVRCAADGRQAWDEIRSCCPDIVISDWEMPQLSGPALCQAIRNRQLPKYVYVVLLTARTSEAEMVEGLEAGADDFISKPLKAPVLLARLRAAMRLLALERRLLEASQRDPLTRLFNRRTFHERFAVEWERSTRYQHPLSCVMMDLDYFKKTNDSYGHAAGDAVLQAVARLLEDRRRASDVLARYGGEEFCLLLTETDEAGAAAWAEQARVALAQARVFVGNQALSISGSFGVATRLADISTPDALLALADQALGVAKESGRNRVVRFSTLGDSATNAPDRPDIYAPLDHALARDVMAPAVYAPHRKDAVDRVADLFLQLRLNAAPVVDDDGLLVGIISENDLLSVAASSPGMDLPIGDCMRQAVVQYDEQTPAKEVYRFLSRASVPRVVVVSQRRPTGVISRATLLRWLRSRSTVHGSNPCALNSSPVENRRAGIRKATDAAADRLAQIRSHLDDCDCDFVPCAVAEATRLEDLAHDILAYCRGQNRV